VTNSILITIVASHYDVQSVATLRLIKLPAIIPDYKRTLLCLSSSLTRLAAITITVLASAGSASPSPIDIASSNLTEK